MQHSRRVVVVLVALVVAVTASIALVVTSRSDSADECSTALVFGVVDGERVLLEDQNNPGHWSDSGDSCGDGQLNGTPEVDTLGLDCKIRDEHGTVVATTTPNRSEGTCGQTDDR